MPGDLIAPLQREGGQLQAGDPPLGPGLEFSAFIAQKSKDNPFIKEQNRLVTRKAQVFHPQLSYQVAGAQSGERQGGIGSTDDDQMHPWRQMVEQKGEPLMDRGRGNDV